MTNQPAPEQLDPAGGARAIHSDLREAILFESDPPITHFADYQAATIQPPETPV